MGEQTNPWDLLQPQDESVIDTLKDMANYAIMTVIEMEMQEDEQRSDM